jgi:hypothetical protein
VNGTIELHFDGDVARDHHVSLRTLGTALQHMQSAVDRAFLDIKYGQVWKHARLRNDDYAETDFVLGYPTEGGYVIDMVSRTGGKIVRRIRDAVSGAIEAAEHEGEEELQRLKGQVQTQHTRIIHGDLVPRSFEQLERGMVGKTMLRAYGDRSIAKEVDLVLSTIRHRKAGDSELRIEFGADGKPSRFHFDGDPVTYSGFLRSLDKGNQYSGMRGKFKNAETQREVTIFIASEEDFDELHPHLKGKHRIDIIASPVIEYGAYDSKGGDIYFIGLAEKLFGAARRARGRR